MSPKSKEHRSPRSKRLSPNELEANDLKRRVVVNPLQTNPEVPLTPAQLAVAKGIKENTGAVDAAFEPAPAEPVPRSLGAAAVEDDGAAPPKPVTPNPEAEPLAPAGEKKKDPLTREQIMSFLNDPRLLTNEMRYLHAQRWLTKQRGSEHSDVDIDQSLDLLDALYREHGGTPTVIPEAPPADSATTGELKPLVAEPLAPGDPQPPTLAQEKPADTGATTQTFTPSKEAELDHFLARNSALRDEEKQGARDALIAEKERIEREKQEGVTRLTAEKMHAEVEIGNITSRLTDTLNLTPERRARLMRMRTDYQHELVDYTSEIESLSVAEAVAPQEKKQGWWNKTPEEQRALGGTRFGGARDVPQVGQTAHETTSTAETSRERDAYDIENLTAYGWTKDEALEILRQRDASPEALAGADDQLGTALAEINADLGERPEQVPTPEQQDAIERAREAGRLRLEEIRAELRTEADKHWFARNLDKYRALPKWKRAMIGGGVALVGAGGAAVGGVLGAGIFGVAWTGSRLISAFGANEMLKQWKRLDNENWKKRATRYGLAGLLSLGMSQGMQMALEKTGAGEYIRSWFGFGGAPAPAVQNGLPEVVRATTASDTLTLEKAGEKMTSAAHKTIDVDKVPEAVSVEKNKEVSTSVRAVQGGFDKVPEAYPPPGGAGNSPDIPEQENPEIEPSAPEEIVAHEPTEMSPAPEPLPTQEIPPLLGEPIVVRSGDNLWNLLGARLNNLPEFQGLSSAGKNLAIDSYIKHLQSFSPSELRELGFRTPNLNKIWPGDNLTGITDPLRLPKPFDFSKVFATIKSRGV